MKSQTVWLCVGAVLGVAVGANWVVAEDPLDAKPAGEAASAAATKDPKAPTSAPIKPAKIAPFVTKGIAWLIAAQNPDGGWGGGSHAHQDVRDPHKSPSDPATTSFTLLSLLRAGHTPVAGEFQAQARRGLEFLVAVVEKAAVDGPKITELSGTQPQSKLGQYVDTSLTAQYLARAIGMLEKTDPLYARTDAALTKCIAKLEASQHDNGGWGEGGGWAPVLQSSFGCSALELAQANGVNVDASKLGRARDYQKQQVAVSAGGEAKAKTEAAAGIELYSFNGAFRGNASDARYADKLVQEAISGGKLKEGSKVTANNLRTLGVDAPRAERLSKAADQNAAQIKRLDDENLLAGFGNNGGEEFVSYLLTSESLVIAGGDKFHQWNDKMHGQLQKIQNTDGSWSGHHCITSPVFCTAAVVQCLTTDRDAEFLIAMAEKTKPSGDKNSEVAQK